ncbi:hypothetical protein [Clostridium oryzae]|uniref:Uncharacterized protein n=1 Tax=Clostridium oryzae TaxID=1450648 RepID=A0A1V4IBE1_9CLOT|nr:hypothetical protein [Clostridium oryzae]OPJ57311.1 hypothetical protein CLORY_41790 [Clostridium oryzae]
MAYINISMTEVLAFVNNNIKYDKDRIEKVSIINENQLEMNIKIGPFFPSIRVVLSYNSFRDGKIYLNVITNGGIKMLMGLVNEFGGGITKKHITVDKNSVIVNINDMLNEKLKDVHLESISISGEQVYVKIAM